jgi:hypothetical protein
LTELKAVDEEHPTLKWLVKNNGLVASKLNQILSRVVRVTYRTGTQGFLAKIQILLAQGFAFC